MEDSKDDATHQERRQPRSRVLIYLAIVGIVATVLRFWGGDEEESAESIFVETEAPRAPIQADASLDGASNFNDGSPQVN
jgi:hypothetical protein